VFDSIALFSALGRLTQNNSQGEYYLTDTPIILQNDGLRVGICTRDLGDEIIGVNTVEQLREVEGILGSRG